MAISEARLEAGMVENDIYKELNAEYMRDPENEGKTPDMETQKAMRAQAKKGSLETFWGNAGFIYLTNKITFNNHSSFNFSYTMFDDYSEKGDSNLRLSYDDRDLKSTSLSLGTIIHADFGLKTSKFLPYLKLDYNEDLTDVSTLKANYVTSSSNQYTTNIKKDFSSSILAETGFDWNFNNGWNLSSTINRIDKNGIGHQNYLKFNAFKVF